MLICRVPFCCRGGYYPPVLPIPAAYSCGRMISAPTTLISSLVRHGNRFLHRRARRLGAPHAKSGNNGPRRAARSHNPRRTQNPAMSNDIAQMRLHISPEDGGPRSSRPTIQRWASKIDYRVSPQSQKTLREAAYFPATFPVLRDRFEGRQTSPAWPKASRTPIWYRICAAGLPKRLPRAPCQPNKKRNYFFFLLYGVFSNGRAYRRLPSYRK